MGSNRRVIVLLLVLAGALALLAWQRLYPGSSGDEAAATGAFQQAGSPGSAPTIPDVALERLRAASAQPAPPQRNLFRFGPKAPPPPPVESRQQTAPAATGAAAGPPPPPPPPRITLRLIGIVESTTRGLKLAVLSDPVAGDTFYGAEGEIIDGRYRVVRIGVESVEMTHVDGRGRQTIPMSGQ